MSFNAIPIPQVSEIHLTYKSKVKASDRPKITNSFDSYEIFKAHWSDQIGFIEEFYMLLLDRSHRVMGRYLVSQGGLAGTVVDAKVIFAAALKCRASCILLAHNHPSGNLRPSQADLNITKKLVQVGKLLDLPVLDHLILSPDGGYTSFADEGMMH
jgi:DNA repair protein RadC